MKLAWKKLVIKVRFLHNYLSLIINQLQNLFFEENFHFLAGRKVSPLIDFKRNLDL
jgi:hypothetical protein